MKNVVKRIASAKGQSLIELTLIFPLLLAMLLGTVEVGRYISVYLGLTHLTREGANLTSRGTDPNPALDAIILAATPTIRASNLNQWTVIYSRIIEDPDKPCPPQPCIYKIDKQITRGNLPKSSKIGVVNQQIQIPGIDPVGPNQTFHAVEVFYDYGPDVFTAFVGKTLNKDLYERTIFTNVSAIP